MSSGRLLGHEVTEETRKKISLANRRYSTSKERDRHLRDRRRSQHLCLSCGGYIPISDMRVSCEKCRIRNRGPKYKEKKRIRSKKIRQDDKNKVLEHYGLVCACCGEKNIYFLTMDHINGGGFRHQKERKGGSLYRWLIKNNYPEGFQTLCYNCNCSRAKYNGICPHKF